MQLNPLIRRISKDENKALAMKEVKVRHAAMHVCASESRFKPRAHPSIHHSLKLFKCCRRHVTSRQAVISKKRKAIRIREIAREAGEVAATFLEATAAAAAGAPGGNEGPLFVLANGGPIWRELKPIKVTQAVNGPSAYI